MTEEIEQNCIDALKRELLRAMRVCSRRGLQTGNGGNASARIPGTERMLIKRSGDSFSDATLSSFVVTDFDGNAARGNAAPSRESVLHGALYRKLPHVNAIVHCHSGWATGWASRLEPLPFATYHARMKLGGTVRVLDTHSYAVSKAFIEEIVRFFDVEPDTKAFLLKGHGQVALGKEVKAALYTAELVEETARIAVIETLLANR